MSVISDSVRAFAAAFEQLADALDNESTAAPAAPAKKAAKKKAAKKKAEPEAPSISVDEVRSACIDLINTIEESDGEADANAVIEGLITSVDEDAKMIGDLKDSPEALAELFKLAHEETRRLEAAAAAADAE